MFTNGEIRRAIEKYQKEHPLHFGQMIDVTAIDSKEGADIISQTVEEISKKVAEDTDLWCICEMAKMYMRGVKPVRPKGEWIIVRDKKWGDIVKCPFCGKKLAGTDLNYCCKCGAEMKGDNK